MWLPVLVIKVCALCIQEKQTQFPVSDRCFSDRWWRAILAWYEDQHIKPGFLLCSWWELQDPLSFKSPSVSQVVCTDHPHRKYTLSLREGNCDSILHCPWSTAGKQLLPRIPSTLQWTHMVPCLLLRCPCHHGEETNWTPQGVLGTGTSLKTMQFQNTVFKLQQSCFCCSLAKLSLPTWEKKRCCSFFSKRFLCAKGFYMANLKSRVLKKMGFSYPPDYLIILSLPFQTFSQLAVVGC